MPRKFSKTRVPAEPGWARSSCYSELRSRISQFKRDGFRLTVRMSFSGRVELRSSDPGRAGIGPPGEAEIQRLNPSRVSSLLRVTGWKTLAPGSLNLVVEDAVIEGLASFEPTFEESPANIIYPPPYEDVPRRRKGYWYYVATARRENREESVLVRRAVVPRPGVVELFSPVSLRDTFNLAANDVINVEIQASRRSTEAGA